ncbi:MAG: rRNA maturation RNase YbeY [Candidatus Pacebacteria bacterium]|nr:rRNA maturation RNase YbeY [Candidatus Paceibacterota bacterium]
MLTIRNFTKRIISRRFILKISKFVLAQEQIAAGGFSLVVVGQKRMAALNKMYRRKKGPTDVLAFSEREASSIFPRVSLDQGLGEIVVCLDIIKKNSKKYGVSFQRELVRIVIHGILHLIGYDHERSKKAAEEMSKKENSYFQQLIN